MGEFKKYRFTQEQIINVLKNGGGGILASKLSNFVGLFDYLRIAYQVKAADVVEMMDAFPEFVF